MNLDLFKVRSTCTALLCLLNIQAQPVINHIASPGKGSHEGNSIVTDAQGNIYLTGQYQTAAFIDGVRLATLLGENVVVNGATDFFLAKFDSSLNPVWVRTAGSSQFDFGTVARITPNGDVLVCGAYQGPITFEGRELVYSGRSDSFIARYSPNGDLIWIQTINGEEDVIPDGMTLDSDGNI